MFDAHRADNLSPVGNSGKPRRGLVVTALLDDLQGNDDAAALVVTAREDAKHQELEASLINYGRATKLLAKAKDAPLALARVYLEAGDVSMQAKSLDYAESCLSNAVLNFVRCADQLDDDGVRKDFVDAVKMYATAVATKSQSQQHTDKKSFLDATRKAFHWFEWALRLIDPTGADVSTAVLGCLSSLGQLAAQLSCYDWALEFLERNQSIKEILGIETDSVRRHMDRISDKIAQYQNSRDAMRTARFREETERLFLDEFRERMELSLIVSKLSIRLIRSIPPPPVPRAASIRTRPSSADASSLFFKTGNFTGMTPQQEIDAFRADVEEGRQLVKQKALEDAQDHFTAAVELAEGSFSIPLDEYRTALGSLAYVFCMRAQTENEKGSKDYRRMMMKSVPHYKKVVEMTEERRASRQSTLEEEVSLAATYLQLGVVAVSLDRPETGLHYMRKAKTLRESFRMDTSQEDRHITTVEKSVRKRDAEVLAHATQLAEARKQTVGFERATFHQCVSWYNAAKALMQQRRVEEAEPLLLQALVGFEQLVGSDPGVRRRPEYRLTLTGLGAAYYFLGQGHGKKTAQYLVDNEQALVYYQQALQLATADAASSDSTEDTAALGALYFHTACCYANLRRYDIAAVNFNKSKEMKVRAGLAVDDIDVNLDALTQRLESLIDEDVLRQQSRQAAGPSGGAGASTANAAASAAAASSSSASLGASTSMGGGYNSGNSSLTTTPRDSGLSGSFDSPKGSFRRNRSVTFLMPSQLTEMDAVDELVTSRPTTPTNEVDSPKLHQTGSILVEQTFASPKVGSPTEVMPRSTASSTSASAASRSYPVVAPPVVVDNSNTLVRQLARLEDLAREIATDLWIPANRAISFIAQEERKERAELFVKVDAVWRLFLGSWQRQSLTAIIALSYVRREEIARKRLVAEFQKEWLSFALQRVVGAEAIARAKIILDHRRIVSLPSAEINDKMVHNQESRARFRILFEHRVWFFDMIESSQRQKIVLLEAQLRRDSLAIPKLQESARVSKGIMFRGSLRLMLSQFRTWIIDGETVDRFGILVAEQRQAALLSWTSAVTVVATHERRQRLSLARTESIARVVDLEEAFHRRRIETAQRDAVREHTRFPMLVDELLAKETFSRRETVLKPQALLFLSTILQPTLELLEEHRRRSIAREWRVSAIQIVWIPLLERNEQVQRRKMYHLYQMQSGQIYLQAIVKLEDTHRRDVMTMRHQEFYHRLAKQFLFDLERLHRHWYIEQEYYRIFTAIESLELRKKRESVSDAENARRRVLRMLHDEAIETLLIDFESAIRQCMIKDEFARHRKMKFVQEREQLVLRETLLRRVGERMALDHRLKHVMSVMVPYAMTMTFVQVSSLKIRSVESLLRSMLAGLAHKTLSQLLRHGYLVIANAHLIQHAKEEQAQRSRTIDIPFLEGLEGLQRRSMAARQREFIGYLFSDHRKGLLESVVDTEVRLRKRTHADEQHARFRVHQLVELSYLCGTESEERQDVIDTWQRKLNDTFVNPMQRNAMILSERVARVEVSDALLAARLPVLLPFVQIVHHYLLTASQMQVVVVSEEAARKAVAGVEDACRASLRGQIRHLNALVQLQLKEFLSRHQVEQQMLDSRQPIHQLMHTSGCTAALLSLTRSQHEGRDALARTEARLRIGCAEAYGRARCQQERCFFERRCLATLAELTSCVEEEARERTWLYGLIYLKHLRDVTHVVLLKQHHLALEEEDSRFTLVREEMEGMQLVVRRFLKTGQLLYIELAEIQSRRYYQNEEYERIQLLQAVAFADMLDVAVIHREWQARSRVEAEARRDRIAIHGFVVMGEIALEESRQWRALTHGFCIEDVTIRQRCEHTAIVGEEQFSWGSLRYEETLATCTNAFFSTAWQQLLVAQSALHATICEQEHNVAENFLTTALALRLNHDEATGRAQLANAEATWATRINDEIHLNSSTLAQRKVVIRETEERLELELEYASDTQNFRRNCVTLAHQASLLSVLLPAAETVNRSAVVSASLRDWGKLVSGALLERSAAARRWMLQLHDFVCHESLDRRRVQEAALISTLAASATWSTVAASLRILQAEVVARRELETRTVRKMVTDPMVCLKFTEIILHQSLEANVYQEERRHWSSIGTQIARTDEEEARVVLSAHQEAELGLVHALRIAIGQVLLLEQRERGNIVVAFHTFMRRHVSVLVMHESQQRLAQVQQWVVWEQFRQALLCERTEHLRLLADQLSEFQEPRARALLQHQAWLGIHEVQRSRLMAHEGAVRSSLGDGLSQHELVVSEFTERLGILSEYHEGLFQCRFGDVLETVRQERLTVAMEEEAARCATEKGVIFGTYLMVQQLVIMHEFTVRLETIVRIQQVVLLEKREFAKLTGLWDAVDLKSSFDSRSLIGTGAPWAAAAAAAAVASSLPLRGAAFVARGLPKLPPLTQAPTSFLRPRGTIPSGVSGEPPSVGEMSPFDKKKSRKHLAAIATAEDVLIREALNIRPASAGSTSAAGTPRASQLTQQPQQPLQQVHFTFASGQSNGRQLLKPISGAMVTFRRSDETEAAMSLLVDRLREEAKRQLTLEAFQRHLVEEQATKQLVQLASARYEEAFRITSDALMLAHMESVSAALFAGMSELSFGLW